MAKLLITSRWCRDTRLTFDTRIRWLEKILLRCISPLPPGQKQSRQTVPGPADPQSSGKALCRVTDTESKPRHLSCFPMTTQIYCNKGRKKHTKDSAINHTEWLDHKFIFKRWQFCLFNSWKGTCRFYWFFYYHFAYSQYHRNPPKNFIKVIKVACIKIEKKSIY